MNALLLDLIILVELLGAGLMLWLGLHLLLHGWGWHRSRSLLAAITLLAASLPAAVGAYHALSNAPLLPLRAAIAKGLLLPLLPLLLLLVRRLAPGVLAVRYRLPLVVALIATIAALGALLWFGPLDPTGTTRQPELLILVAVAWLLSLAAILQHVTRTRRLLASPPERSATLSLAIAALLALSGLILLLFELTLASASAPQGWLSGWTVGQRQQIALAGALLRLGAGIALARAIVQQARAEAAPHLASLGQALLTAILMLLVFLAVGGLIVVRFGLPRWLTGIFMLLALVTSALDQVVRGASERLLHRGERGKLRQELRQIADRVVAQEATPPALRPLLVRLARHLNSSQLAFAQSRGSGSSRSFEIVAAVRPAWVGKTVEVRYPDEWAERSSGGWTFPIRKQSQTVGLLVSEETGALSPVQVQFLHEAAAEIVQLIEEWGQTEGRQAALAKSLGDFRTHSDGMAARLRSLATPPPAPPNLRGAVTQFLKRWSESDALLGDLPLARLTVVTRLLPDAQAGSPAARGNAARSVIQHLVEQVRPLQGDLPSQPDESWLPYLTLTRLYLHNQPRQDFLDEYRLTARQATRAERRGIERVARHLGEMEAAMRQRAPVAGSAPPLAPPVKQVAASKPAQVVPASNVTKPAPPPPPPKVPAKRPTFTMPSFGRRGTSPDAGLSTPGKSLRERFTGLSGNAPGKPAPPPITPKPTPSAPPAKPASTIPVGSRARPVPKPEPSTPKEETPSPSEQEWQE